MNRIDLDALKSNIDLRTLAGQYTTLNGRGDEQYGPCPLCGGKDRFHVTGDWFFCRLCHPTEAGKPYGDVITFAMWLNGLDFKAGCDWLTNGNVPIQNDGAIPKYKSRPYHRITPPTEQWQNRARAFVKYAQKLLWQTTGRTGLDYLLKRGLTGATIKATGLGYNPKDIYDSAKRWKVTNKDSIWLPGPGIVIPWFVEGSQLWRVNIRLLEPRQGKNGKEIKYIGPAGWAGSNPLYNAVSLTPLKPGILVEGEFCALTIAQEAGDLVTAVATGSTEGSQSYKWLARLAACPLVLVSFDSEPDKGDRAARFWLKLLPNGKRWRPLLKDINDMHRAGLDVRQWIKVGLGGSESKLDSGWPRKILWPADTPLATVVGQTRRVNGQIEATYHDQEQLALCLELTRFARKLEAHK